MSGTWGRRIKYSIFGESHGEAIGINIDGLPAGIHIDKENIEKEMKRRAPGNSSLATPRKEADNFEILSGVFNGKTTGAPLCAIIRNTNKHSSDYDILKYNMRPGHADFTGNIRYNGFNDYRGGGHFSGRLTAPLVLAGAIAKQILTKFDIIICSHIARILNEKDKALPKLTISKELAQALSASDFPLLDASMDPKMREIILKAKSEGDSVGGIIECGIYNVPSGKGDPFFDSVESNLSHLLFSIPAVKGVEFGEGFDLASMYGSEANDAFEIINNKVHTKSNNNGGLLGGITSGMPILFKCVIKPTPSIAKEQDSVDINKKENIKLCVKGRHDPCIVPRALPVIEAAAAMVILDYLYDSL